MKCPFCSKEQSKVTDKREAPLGIRRRRECLNCKKRYTTYEKIDKSEIHVIKKDGSREKFDIEKLQRGIQRAFEKRPIPKEKIDQLVESLEEKIRKKGKKEIKSSNIGEMIIKKIQKLDNIAYIRFASVYRNFQDLDDFKNQLKELK